jgi:DNA-binding MarR family transcriptional regulator
MLKTSSGRQEERTATTTITPSGAARGRQRLTQALRRAAMSGAGLGDSDFRVLEALLHKWPLPVNTIGAKVWLTPGSISVAIDRLEKRALAKRKNIDDRRVRMIELTAKGRALVTNTVRVTELYTRCSAPSQSWELGPHPSG